MTQTTHITLAHPALRQEQQDRLQELIKAMRNAPRNAGIAQDRCQASCEVGKHEERPQQEDSGIGG